MKKEKGSFTIEAALVIPMLMFVILLTVQLCFFLYNRQAITVIASQAALYGVQMETEGKATIETQLEAFIKEETENRLLFTESVDWNVKVTAVKVSVSISFSQNTLIKQVNDKISIKKNRLLPAIILWEKERWTKQ